MIDKFQFSNAQDLGSLDSTGVVSEHIWDLEEDEATDGMLLGWVNFIILASSNSGGNEGLWVELRCDDTSNLAMAGAGADEKVLGAILLDVDEIEAGAAFSFGVCRYNLGKYAGLWYRAASTSFNGATTVDAWFSEQPVSAIHGIQKKPS